MKSLSGRLIYHNGRAKKQAFVENGRCLIVYNDVTFLHKY